MTRFVFIICRAVDNVQRKLDRTKDTLRERLEHTHPVLSRIKPWIEAKLRLVETLDFLQIIYSFLIIFSLSKMLK